MRQGRHTVEVQAKLLDEAKGLRWFALGASLVGSVVVWFREEDVALTMFAIIAGGTVFAMRETDRRLAKASEPAKAEGS